MRILMVQPGPDFSVADVFNGWYKALKAQGHHVMVFNTSDRLMWYSRTEFADEMKPQCPECGQYPHSAPLEGIGPITQHVFSGLFENAYVFWPDLIFFVSAFWVKPEVFRVLKSRGHKLAILHTESPYEDERQFVRGQHVDINLLNDPTNVELWNSEGVDAHYMPHAYDPDVHYPGVGNYESDFSFVGTMYKSRQELFSKIDFGDLKVTLAGAGYDKLEEENKWLLKYCPHHPEDSFNNVEGAELYRRSRVGINLYRREGENNELQYQGWAMGPRELEMAACGLFFLRDPRPESDETFKGILPSFSGPEDASEKIQWWAKHDSARERKSELAMKAIEDRTFDNNAKQFMSLLAP